MAKDFSHHLDKLIVVGDRALVRPKSKPDKTRSGLFLPPGYSEKETIQSGYVVKVGPGFPIPMPVDNDQEPWKQNRENSRYMPMQAKEGDLAIFLQREAIEIHYNNERYFIVNQQSILLLEREDDSNSY